MICAAPPARTLAVAVLAAAAACVASGPASASSIAWYQVYQVKAPGSFQQIAAVSRTDIWAVGDLCDSQGRFTYRPLIRHSAGHGWQTVTIAGSPRFESEWVSASGADNVWVFGLTPKGADVAYRYDGSRWKKMPVPAQPGLQGAVAVGARYAWAFGASGIFHWNGSRWRGYSLAHGNFGPESISASGAKNAWVSGTAWAGGVQHAVAYHWNGTGWHYARIPRIRTDFDQVAAFAPSDVWIGWETVTHAYVTHWNGHGWHTMTTPTDVNANTLDIVKDGDGGYWFGDAAILTGTTWTSEPLIPITGSLQQMALIPGTKSVIETASVRFPGSTTQDPVLYRFDL